MTKDDAERVFGADAVAGLEVVTVEYDDGTTDELVDPWPILDDAEMIAPQPLDDDDVTVGSAVPEWVTFDDGVTS